MTSSPSVCLYAQSNIEIKDRVVADVGRLWQTLECCGRCWNVALSLQKIILINSMFERN